MSPMVKLAIETLELYPLALIVCWSLKFTVAIATISGSSIDTNVTLQLVVQVFYTFHGSFVAVIFFMKSKEARLQWAIFFQPVTKRICGCEPDEHVGRKPRASATPIIDDQYNSNTTIEMNSYKTMNESFGQERPSGVEKKSLAWIVTMNPMFREGQRMKGARPESAPGPQSEDRIVGVSSSPDEEEWI